MEEPPLVMDVGEAVKEEMVGTEGGEQLGTLN